MKGLTALLAISMIAATLFAADPDDKKKEDAKPADKPAEVVKPPVPVTVKSPESVVQFLSTPNGPGVSYTSGGQSVNVVFHRPGVYKFESCTVTVGAAGAVGVDGKPKTEY